jgi:NADH:ubiquinone oxidoreductase subunit 6 (subunit J)
MSEFFFFLTAILAIAGAIGVITLRNPFFNVLALVCHLIALAGLFLLLRAEFVAFAQVIVYAGAVMVLYVFVVAYVGGQDEPLHAWDGPAQKAIAAVFGTALFVELCVAILGTSLKAVSGDGAPYEPGFGSPAQIGELLLTRFLFAFEAASVLLLIAAVGAVVLARRRGGIHEGEQRLSVADLLRPPGTGTMAESVSGTTGTPAIEPGRDEDAPSKPEQVGVGAAPDEGVAGR